MPLFRLGPDSFFGAGRDKGTEERVKSSMGERGGKAKMIKNTEIFNNGRL